MVYSVFISHSTKNLSVVKELAKWLRANKVTVYMAEEQIQAGQKLSTKVSGLINQSDCILAILTVEGVRSKWVNQEIGYAVRAGKLVVPVVEEGVEVKGFLESLEYIPFDRRNPYDAVTRAVEYLRTLAIRKEEQERARTIFAGLLLFFGLLALSASGGE